MPGKHAGWAAGAIHLKRLAHNNTQNCDFDEHKPCQIGAKNLPFQHNHGHNAHIAKVLGRGSRPGP